MRLPNAWMLASAAALLATPAAAEPAVDYATQIKPIFERHCVTCHGALRKQAGLRLDAIQFLRAGGDSGEGITPGDAAGSVLVAALKGEGGYDRMPKEADPLPAEEIALIERWIAEGAVAPENEPVAGDPAAHWSFRRIARPAVPVMDGAGNPIDAFVIAARVGGPKGAAHGPEERASAEGGPAGTSPVRGHAHSGLGPATHVIQSVGTAPRHILLRRVYLDLIGLPPSPEELRAFLADDSPEAYERVVDRLLADPRHGERWGRHWMDVWRYSDWYGYDKELRNSQKHIWRWRDWIVESVNSGKPYDRMLVEMLAADEVAPADPDALRATGFLARNYYKFNRDVWLDRDVEHTGKAFLGLTFNCARCHDHMFDPIAQRDYYALKAIFAPHQVRIEPIGGVLDPDADGLPRAYDADANAVTYLFVRGNDKNPDKENPIAPTLPGYFVRETPVPNPVPLPATSFYPGLRPEVRATLRRQAEAEVIAADEAVRKLVLTASVPVSSEPQGVEPVVAPKPWPSAAQVAEAKLRAARVRRAALEARIAADDAKYATPSFPDAETMAVTAATAERAAAFATAEANAAAAESAVPLARAKPEAERAKAVEAAQKALDEARKALETAKAEAQKTDGSYSPLTAVYPATSTGRRAALANWIVDTSNPLTARVAVNHVWGRHFGRPLVKTVFDFGMHGVPPTHPELLDWLAAELIASGWDLKHLHRLIVTSETYRLDSNANPKSQISNPKSVDPDNTLLWHWPSRRAEAEVVRDSLLAVSGVLEERLGGPELDETADQTTRRRSIYYRHAPEKYAPFLTAFDGANADECYRRAETIVPQQALAQVNSRLSREQSRLVAAELAAADAPIVELIALAFERVLCRPPTSEEREACTGFLAEQEARLTAPASLSTVENGPEVSVPAAGSPKARAFADLVHVLLNHHDFVTIR